MFKSLVRIIVTFSALLFVAWFFLTSPVFYGSKEHYASSSNSESLKAHVIALTVVLPATETGIQRLDAAADYIFNKLESHSASIKEWQWWYTECLRR